MSLWKRSEIEPAPFEDHFTLAGGPRQHRPPAAEEVVAFELVEELLVEPVVPRPLPPSRPATPSSFLGKQDGITTEWARRLVGPAPPGRVVGKCGKCATRLAVSVAPRPLRVCCPECGRARVLPS